MPTVDQQLMRVTGLECRAMEGGSQYEISFSSETPYVRWGAPEILLHDEGAVDLSRFENGSAVMMFSHGRDPNYGRVPIGKVVRAWLDRDQRRCRAVVEFDEDDEACRRLKVKLDKGMLTGVSVGYRVAAWTELKAGTQSADGRFVGPANIASYWQPYEISLEPTPADASVGLGRNLENGQEEQVMSEKTTAVGDDQGMQIATNGGSGRQQTEGTPEARTIMSSSVVGQWTAPSVSVGAVDVAAERTRAVAEERARINDISALCRSFDVEAQEYVGGGHTVDQVRTLILDKLAKERPAIRAGVGGDVTVVQDEMDRVRSAAVDGLLMRCNIAIEAPADGALELRGMSVQRIASECLSRAGEANVLRMSDDKLFERSLTPDSAFTSIMAGVADKVVLSAHAAAPTTFQLWTSRGTATDFKPTEFYEISASGSLDEVPQNGELKEGRLSDAPVAVRRLLTFGKKISFTRQMFINDDVQMIARTMAAYTLAFARGTNKAVYDILKSNPAMYDGSQLFSIAHKNLATGGAPSTATFSEARRLMRGQTDLGGEVKLNIAPAYILCGSYDETEIEKLLTSLADPSGYNSGVTNVFRNRMQPIVEAELDMDTVTQPYFFVADPRLADTIEVSYLNGIDSPTVETRQEFDRLGLSFRVFGDRGVTLLGYKGIVKNPGKALK